VDTAGGDGLSKEQLSDIIKRKNLGDGFE
jgi:hypothetical protein